ncbi:MAG: hypothetical protein ACKVJU_19965 [Verrucomicrobiales bacterium]
MEFLSEESDFSKKNSREDEDPNAAGGNLILWGVAIMVLLGLNAFSWIFCMFVFGHPEDPFCYKLLSKLEKVPEVKGFSPTTAPRGDFFSVKQMYAKIYPYTDGELKAYNDIKKRHYVKNFYERSDATFISGEFVVQNVRKLGENDVFPRGFAIRARAESFPDGLVDFVIPAGSEDDLLPISEKEEDEGKQREPMKLIPIPDRLYVAGEVLKIEESATCAVLLHIDRQENDEMVMTVVPVVNRAFKAANGAELTSRPPQRLNLAAKRWPLSDNGLVSNPIGPTGGEDETKPAEKEDDTVAVAPAAGE